MIILFFYILILFLEAYSAVIVIFVIILLLRKKKLPWGILIRELGCLILFFYFKFLLDEHRLILIGDYVDGTKGWGSGLANVEIYTYNLAIVIGLFLITQIVFWIFFVKKFRRINNPVLNNKSDLENLLSSDKEKIKQPGQLL